ncbi:SecDF P1 head subdomain-containing protein [Demequina muriae]|uniref:SecDF P1 head subdomain domain-containing protein n=1 Tax=Demequina muriae TaxID=3051664 RepID=A0ABT8GE27_9MICO|nr:hypothetical protein [Demequina sp. EGI L300058]MDN4479681.1 hypothetical protein [Demequina sp. EGI L300058]
MRSSLTRLVTVAGVLAGVAALSACGPGDDGPGEDAAAVTFRPVEAAVLVESAGDALPPEVEGHEAADWFAAGDCAAEAPTGEGFAAACSADGSEIFLLGATALDGTDVESVEVTRDDETGDAVTLTFSEAGTQALADLTEEAVGQPQPGNRIAIVVDGTVLASPVVQSAITNGLISVFGGTGDDVVQAIADALD